MKLNIEVNKVEGVLVRVLGLVSRRGFSVTSFSAKTTGNFMDLSLEVDSERPVSLLICQLEKLFDVISVSQVST